MSKLFHKSHNNNPIRMNNDSVADKIVNKQAIMFFNTNDQIESVWIEYKAARQSISEQLSAQMLETNRLIKKNYSTFSNKYNKELLQIFQDISNDPKITQKESGYLQRLSQLKIQISQSPPTLTNNVIKCSFRIADPKTNNNEIPHMNYEKNFDYRISNHFREKVSLFRTKILKKEPISFRNIQSIENYICYIDLHVIHIKLWSRVKKDLEKKILALALFPPYNSKDYRFDPNDELIQYFLQILEDIANETLTDYKEFDNRIKKIGFYVDESRKPIMVKLKNDPVQTITVQPPILENIPKEIDNPPQQLVNPEKTPDINISPHVKKSFSKDEEKAKQKTNHSKKFPLSFRSCLTIGFSALVFTCTLYAYFHGSFGFQKLFKKIISQFKK